MASYSTIKITSTPSYSQSTAPVYREPKVAYVTPRMEADVRFSNATAPPENATSTGSFNEDDHSSVNSFVRVGAVLSAQPDVLSAAARIQLARAKANKSFEDAMADAARAEAARAEAARAEAARAEAARAEAARAEAARIQRLRDQAHQKYEDALAQAEMEAERTRLEMAQAEILETEMQQAARVRAAIGEGEGIRNQNVTNVYVGSGPGVDSLLDQLLKLPIPSVRAWVTQFIMYCMFFASMYYAYSYVPSFSGSQAAVPSHVLPDVSHVCTGLMTRDLYDGGMQVCRGHPSTGLLRYCMLPVDVTTPAKKPEDLKDMHCVPSTLPLSPEHASKFIPRIKTCYKALVHGEDDIDAEVIDSVIAGMNGCMIGKLDAYVRDLNRDHGGARYVTDPEVVTDESVVEATFKQVDEVAAEETGSFEQCVRQTGDDIWNDYEIAYPKEREAYAKQVTKCMDQYPMKQRGVEVELKREETAEKARQQIEEIIESVERSADAEVAPYDWMPSTTTMMSTAVVGGTGALTYGVHRGNKVCLAIWMGAKAIAGLGGSVALTVYGWLGADNFARLVLPMFRANVADWQTEIGILRGRMMDPWAYWELVWVLKHRHEHRAPPPAAGQVNEPAANQAAEPAANQAAEPAAEPAVDAQANEAPKRHVDLPERPDVVPGKFYADLQEYQKGLEQKAAHIKEVDAKAIAEALADEPIGSTADRTTLKNAAEADAKAQAKREADDKIAAKRMHDRRQAEVERAEVKEKAAVQAKINAKHKAEVAEQLEIQQKAAETAIKESKSKADANSEIIAKYKASVQAENDRASQASSAAQVKPEVAQAEVAPPPPPKSKRHVESSDRVLRPRK